MDKDKLILARLNLAQEILEESDALPGAEGYSVDQAENFVHHSRHEREALVVYLLLTCFDLLGQSREFITFYEWLSSKKTEILSEHRDAIESLAFESDAFVESAKALHEHYNKIYGVTRAFHAGVENLPPSALAHLLASVSVSKRDPESLKPENKNTIYPTMPVTSEEKLYKLKLKFLYSQRNAFTHKLSQKHTSSNPGMSCFINSTGDGQSRSQGASWTVWVSDGKVYYGSSQEGDSKHVFSTQGWPFVLFEVLYSAIGKKFDRTEINLKFSVFDIDNHQIFQTLEHKDLPAFLEENYRIKLSDWSF
ncbi:hypothetical protein [Pseudomonas cichorii]|uniref:Uncharacterized protein n=1 Tax=Pseudomonas cichorii TaxID=36746 RepID=A0ABQ1DHF6_PSECI|nr:hypothetical protein [Pseudomonas cichorii]QVE19169.1 hypothetical protein KGD89_10740 [Pseudomonas cichorii]GFM90405.1 hypothetical protein PSCICP_03770 [Pseudomonas cichorii]SDN53319.1 hypothetical protein SAMN05216599_102278 [Pseudomonas cichorii]